MMKKFYVLLAIGLIGIAPAIRAMDKPITEIIAEALKPNKDLVEKLAKDPFLAKMMALECLPNDMYAQGIIREARALTSDKATVKKNAHET